MRLPELARQVYKLPDATVHKHFLSNEGRIADDVCSKAGVFFALCFALAAALALVGAALGTWARRKARSPSEMTTLWSGVEAARLTHRPRKAIEARPTMR